MRKLSTLVLGLGIALVSSTASADWYSGDPSTAAATNAQFTDNLSESNQILALTFDNFTWVPGAGGGVIDIVGGHFHSFNSLPGSILDTAYWEIRTGMAHNVAGTLVASGSGIVTTAPTAFVQGGAAVTSVSVDVPNFALPAGNYWIGLALGSTTGQTGFFVAGTNGANGIGSPLGDNNALYFQSVNNGATVTWNYIDFLTMFPNATDLDPSFWIKEVPEPGMLGLLAPGALMALHRRKS